MIKEQIDPDNKLPLELTAEERKILLEEVISIDPDLEEIIRNTPAGHPILLTLDDLASLIESVAAEANHTKSKKLEKKLDHIYDKIQHFFDAVTDESLPTEIPPEFLLKLILPSTKLPTPKKTAKPRSQKEITTTLKLTKLQRETLGRTIISPLRFYKRFNEVDPDTTNFEFTLKELYDLLPFVEERIPHAPSPAKARLKAVAKKINKILDAYPPEEYGIKKKPLKKVSRDAGFQLKITLEGIEPPIWRRVEVKNCTLADLHYVIQRTFGWENSHMWLFLADRKQYSTPEMYHEDDWGDVDETLLSQIAENKPRKFLYIYDMGDEWRHVIRIEKTLPADPKRRLAQCLDGERACPPEDCGGIWGYVDFLEAIADPEHESHEELLEWIGGDFDPEEFDLKKTNIQLRRMA